MAFCDLLAASLPLLLSPALFYSAGVICKSAIVRPPASAELLEYFDRLVEVKHPEKTLYDHVVVDSETIERRFAEDLDVREDVRFYFKLPRWFKIDTPIGGYNPDWAVVFEGDKRIYFVAETKGTANLEELKPSEKMKILCGRKHFAEFADISFEAPVTRLEEMLLKAA